ncbi:cation-translocating P-type ATPase [Solirubrobacter soli]|uniref:cation-translocating P-type ATPase n=1 Tax=Solirubrobacter soli TaxID=363832 RepID=UPI000413288C|nr:cation-transporting P-type ATPase [Solirubrobacter soli]
MATTTAPAQTAEAVPTWHSLTRDDAVHELHVEPEHGLTSEEAAERLTRYGPNKFAEAKAEPRWHAFLRQYRDPMQIVLLVAGVVSIYPVKQPGTGIMILALTLLNAVLGLSQEGKAAAAVAALAKMMIIKARVRRDGKLAQLPAEQLVPGDVVEIEAGDVIPADGRLLAAATLEIAESALTGESVPVGKGVELVEAPDAPLGDRTDMVYMNTNVTRGSGRFVVTATGMQTEVGHISGMLQHQDESKSPLTVQLEKLTKQLVTIAGLALVASVALNMLRGQSFTEVFTVAVAFSIAAIPTGLPAVVTTILSRGTRLLADANAIVKRLRSTETLGATSAICSDKTGTLTLNQMTAVELTIPGRRYKVSGSGYSTEGKIKHVAGDPEIPLEPFMLPLALACDAVLTDAGEMIGDPTEGALVVLAEKGGLDLDTTRERYPRVAELPFDTAYKLMATFHRMTDDAGADVVRCFVKGAPDQLLARSSSHLDPAMAVAPADDSFKERYLGENERLAKQGLRVMATARKDFDPAAFDPKSDLLTLMNDLTLLALVGIVDPPRPAAKAAIETAHSAGIQVRMITGDHAITAEAIARTLGIPGRAITGAQFAELDDAQADEQIDEIGVIARVTPEQKVRLVDILKRKGHVVGMTGDGVNDAPALKRADIGIAMGITGTEVSKEAAAMILTDDNFATIVKAIKLGRGLYDNLVKYIRFQMGALAGMILTFLGASILNIASGIPFLPMQTLWVNFTTQVFQAIGLGYGEPAEGLMERKPRKPEAPILRRADTHWFVIAGIVMAGATLGVAAGAEHSDGADLARTMALTTFSIGNLLFSFTARDELRSVFSLDTFNDRTFIVASLLSAVAIIFATELNFFQRILDTVEMTGDQWLICIGAALTIIVASELWKLRLRRQAHHHAAPESA